MQPWPTAQLLHASLLQGLPWVRGRGDHAAAEVRRRPGPRQWDLTPLDGAGRRLDLEFMVGRSIRKNEIISTQIFKLLLLN